MKTLLDVYFNEGPLALRDKELISFAGLIKVNDIERNNSTDIYNISLTVIDSKGEVYRTERHNVPMSEKNMWLRSYINVHFPGVGITSWKVVHDEFMYTNMMSEARNIKELQKQISKTLEEYA